MEHTNARFKHFLELKKQRIHFNEKLARSSALKNPKAAWFEAMLNSTAFPNMHTKKNLQRANRES